MSTDLIALKLEKRDVLGKQVRQLRREGQIPAVVHDHGKESLHVMVPYLEMVKVWNKAGKHHPLELQIGSAKHMALIKDIHLEPRKYQIQHVVFNAIKQNEKVEAEVPVELVGEIPAEKISLLVLTQLDAVKIEAYPKDLPDVIHVDASTLAEVGDNLTVADLHVPAGVVVLTEPETQIAIVEMPKDQIAEADAAAAEMAAANAADVPAEEGGDTPQDTQAGEDQSGGKKQFEPKEEQR